MYEKDEGRMRVFATIFHLLEIFDSHTYHYEVFIMGFIAQPFVKALIHFNKYLIEPIMILTAMKQLSLSTLLRNEEEVTILDNWWILSLDAFH